jgi:hypothetical protein
MRAAGHGIPSRSRSADGYSYQRNVPSGGYPPNPATAPRPGASDLMLSSATSPHRHCLDPIVAAPRFTDWGASFQTPHPHRPVAAAGDHHRVALKFPTATAFTQAVGSWRGSGCRVRDVCLAGIADEHAFAFCSIAHRRNTVAGLGPSAHALAASVIRSPRWQRSGR